MSAETLFKLQRMVLVQYLIAGCHYGGMETPQKVTLNGLA